MKKHTYSLLRLLAVLVTAALLFSQTNTFLAIFQPARAYAVGELTVNWGIGTGNVGPIFSVPNMAPGDSETRNVTITNASVTNQPVAIKGVPSAETGDIGDVMNITIKDDATVLYSGTLSQFFTDSLSSEGISLLVLPPAASKVLAITVTFQTSAGNEYQEKTVVFDIIFGIAVEIPEECSFIDLTGKFPIFGTNSNDKINGTTGDDIIFGFAGIDKVYGKGGHDCLIGGPGIDTLRGETGNDVIFGEDGNDDLIGAVGNDTLFGGNGDDDMDGEDGVDYLEGNSGNDDMEGGNNNDTMYGGNGRDDLNGENGNDSMYGEADQDDIDGGGGNDYAEGGLEKDDLNGRAGNDTLLGGADVDDVNGHAGTDTCEGEDLSSCEIVL